MGNVLELPAMPSPIYHVYAGSRAPWTTIQSTADQFETVPVRTYKLPEAERFGTAFCGSLVPHTVPTSEFANVPAGCLDSDPGVRPSGHIHVAYKANWFEIDDDLPRLEAPSRG